MVDLVSAGKASMADVMTDAVRKIWDNLSIGVAIVNSTGICVYMNEVQRRIDGFSRTPVVGKHISELYLPPSGSDRTPTMECLLRGEPLLRKAYWYRTVNNSLFSSVTDFFPLFENGRKDGVIAFTIWLDAELLSANKSGKKAPSSPKEGITEVEYGFEDLIGTSKALTQAVHVAKAAAESSASVMIWGESGTGKEVIAQAIHAASSRHSNPFISVNCAAIPETLLEGILFGTVKGAFTDAQDSPGLFEKADGGTILLDELNSLPLTLQAKLLRVVQERRVRRLGSQLQRKIDVRVISSLNIPPLEAVNAQILRHDLYYRLAVVSLVLPPLRNRREDIPDLCQHFIRTSDFAVKGLRISDEVMDMFHHYTWPGNVRELQHVIEGSIALLEGSSVITLDCLPQHFIESYRSADPIHPKEQPAKINSSYDDYANVKRSSVIPLKERLQEYEENCIRNVLRVTGGNVAKAARIMQLTPPGLRYKMQMLGISVDDE